MKIKVLYEDSNILAIDKPSGISVHGDGRTKEKTITDWVLENYPKMKNVGEPMRINVAETSQNLHPRGSHSEGEGRRGENFVMLPRPGIVHRLDRDTSGVLLLAKNQKAHEFLKKQFQERTIKKTYVAIVNGWVKNDHGVVNKPIGRSPSDFRRWLAGRGARGELREAVTEYKVLKRFIAPCEIKSTSPQPSPCKGEGEKFTYLEVKPKTGRTHQIRVHMKFLNHPVVCDSLYNPDQPYPKEITRMALHAKQIEFKNLKGETIKVESPLPAQFKKVVK